MAKVIIRRCYGTWVHDCNGAERAHWRVTSRAGYTTYWHTWHRAMLRATRGW